MFVTFAHFSFTIKSFKNYLFFLSLSKRMKNTIQLIILNQNGVVLFKYLIHLN